MSRFTQFISVVILSIMLTACGSAINQESFSKIKNGMTKDEVINILGKPTESASMGMGAMSGTTLMWKSADKQISIQLINDKVVLKTLVDIKDKN